MANIEWQTVSFIDINKCYDHMLLLLHVYYNYLNMMRPSQPQRDNFKIHFCAAALFSDNYVMM